MQTKEHIVVNESVHTACKQHQRVCMQICLQMCSRTLCEWGPNLRVHGKTSKHQSIDSKLGPNFQTSESLTNFAPRFLPTVSHPPHGGELLTVGAGRTDAQHKVQLVVVGARSGSGSRHWRPLLEHVNVVQHRVRLQHKTRSSAETVGATCPSLIKVSRT